MRPDWWPVVFDLASFAAIAAFVFAVIRGRREDRKDTDAKQACRVKERIEEIKEVTQWRTNVDGRIKGFTADITRITKSVDRLENRDD